MTIKSRKYLLNSDFLKVRQLIIDSYKKGGDKINWFIDRWETQYMDSRLASEEQWKSDIFLWEDKIGSLKSALIQENPGRFHFIIDPDYRNLEQGMIDTAIDYCKKNNPQGEDQIKLHIWAMGGDSLEEKLTNNGFVQIESLRERFRKQDLLTLNTDYTLPEGYTLRQINLDNIHYRKQLVELDHNCFPWSNSDIQSIYTLKEMPSFNENLNIVAIAPDKSFAAFCFLWYNEENKYSIFEPVGTHSEHRKKRLGKAILLEALKRVKKMGAETGFVFSYFDPAHALYSSVGFKEVNSLNGWEKIII